MDESETAAVARARAGDREAFRELVERHSRAVFRLAYRLTGNEEDAEDVVQEAFIKVYKSLDRFDERAAFSSWLYRIVTNCALDARRRRKVRHADGMGEEDELPATTAPEASPERAAIGAEISRRVAAAMSRLTAAERAAFVLRHYEGRPVVEIAETLRISAGATRNTIFRAVAKLRTELAMLAGRSRSQGTLVES